MITMGQFVDISTLVGKTLVSVRTAQRTSYTVNTGTAKKPKYETYWNPFSEKATLTFADGSIYTIERENAQEDTSVQEILHVWIRSKDLRNTEAVQAEFDGTTIEEAKLRHEPFAFREVYSQGKPYTQKDIFWIRADECLITIIFICCSDDINKTANVQLVLQDEEQS